MGPYYRGTSNGVGAFFDLFYQHPLLMLAFVLGTCGLAAYCWYRKKAKHQGRD
jgi:hypothetical protein